MHFFGFLDRHGWTHDAIDTKGMMTAMAVMLEGGISHAEAEHPLEAFEDVLPPGLLSALCFSFGDAHLRQFHVTALPALAQPDRHRRVVALGPSAGPPLLDDPLVGNELDKLAGDVAAKEGELASLLALYLGAALRVGLDS